MKYCVCVIGIAACLSLTCADLSCYTGTSSDGNLKSKSCPQICEDASGTKSSSDVMYCATFKKSSSSTYLCDCKSICAQHQASTSNGDSSKFVISNITINGTLGTLSCCQGNLCNSRKSDDTTSKIKCLVGDFSSYEEQACEGNVAWCMETTVMSTSSSIRVSPFSCDSRNECTAHGIADKMCKVVNDTNVPGLSKKLCCCTARDRCNRDFVAATLFPLSTPSPRPTATSDDDTNTKDLRHWIFVGGILAGIMFGMLVFILVAVVIKRLKQRRNTQLTYTYAQLTEDLATDERDVDDERMIVA